MDTNPNCESCRDTGFVFIKSFTYGHQIQACDCGKLKTDEDAVRAVEEAIIKARKAITWLREERDPSARAVAQAKLAQALTHLGGPL